jgi:hypothetical protein
MTLIGKGLGQETQIQIKIEVVKQHETHKIRKTKTNEGEKSLNNSKREISLVESQIMLCGNSIYGLG